MFIMPSFKKSLIVEQFQGNYLNWWGIVSAKGIHGRVSVETIDRPSIHISSDSDRQLHRYSALGQHSINILTNTQLTVG